MIESVSRVDSTGSVHVPAFELPLSAALSNRAREALQSRQSVQQLGLPRLEGFETEEQFAAYAMEYRKLLDERIAIPLAEKLALAHPASICARVIGGVPVEEFTPIAEADSERILINLHGGAYLCGATHIGRIESIPMAHLGRFRVISVDYRQGPEHKFPAASEDVCSVYRELLKSWAPQQIGIYGGSAGASLAMQSVGWILNEGLPCPGAMGVFCGGPGGSGDSAYFSAVASEISPPDDYFESLHRASVGYFSNVSANDYLANPVIAPPEFRAKFPPSLFLTGTRAFDLSPVIASHRALVQASVDASLHVFDGLGHCFYYDTTLPEALDAYEVAIRFFRLKLALD